MTPSEALALIAETDGAALIDASPTIEGVATNLAAVRAAAVALKAIDADLSEFLAQTMPGGEMVVEGLGFVARTWQGPTWKWAGAQLALAVGQQLTGERALVDAETGEKLDAWAIVEPVLAGVLDVAAVGYARMGAIKRLPFELDESEWREQTRAGHYTVRIVSGSP